MSGLEQGGQALWLGPLAAAGTCWLVSSMTRRPLSCTWGVGVADKV